MPPSLLVPRVKFESMPWPSIMRGGLPYVGGFLNELRICLILNERN